MNENPAADDLDRDIDPEELLEAVNDTQTTFSGPENSPETEDLIEWDQPVDAEGHAAHKVLPEDEIPAAVQMVYEGMEEADTEQRVAAVDPEDAD